MMKLDYGPWKRLLMSHCCSSILMVIVANCLTCEVAQAQMGVSIIQNSGVSAVKGYGSSWRYLIQIFRIVRYTHRGSTIVFMLLKHNI